MAKKRTIFGVPISWFKKSRDPRKSQLPTTETQTPTQPSTTTPAQRPPSGRSGLSPTKVTPLQAQASSKNESQQPSPSSSSTQSPVTSQPASPSHAAAQSQAGSQSPSPSPSPSRAATQSRDATQPQSPSPATPQPSSPSHMAFETQLALQAGQLQSPPTLMPQPAVQTSSPPPSPSLTATQAQLAAGAVTQPPLPPEKLQQLIPKGSQPPPSSTEPPLSVYQEEQKPIRSQTESPELQPKEERTYENVLNSENHTENQINFHPNEMPKQPPQASVPAAMRDGEEEQNPVKSQPESQESHPKEERTSENVLNSENQIPNQTTFQPNEMPKQPSEVSVTAVVRDGDEEQKPARSQPESQESHPKEERTSENVLNSENHTLNQTTFHPKEMPKQPLVRSVPADGEEEQKSAKSQPESQESHPKEERTSENVLNSENQIPNQTTSHPNEMAKQPSEVSVTAVVRDGDEEQKPARSQPESQESDPKEERTSENVLNSENHTLNQTTFHPKEMPKQPLVTSVPADGGEEQKSAKSQPESQESHPKEERISENILNSQNHAPSQMTFQPNVMPKQSSEASVLAAVVAPTSTATLETAGPAQKFDSSLVSAESKPLQESDAKSEEISESCHKPTISNGKRAPLLKEIREDISKFVHKMATQHPKLPMDEKLVTVITLIGENRGASMQLGLESTKKDGAIHIRRGYMINPDEDAEVTTDEEGSSEDSRTEEDQATKAYINGNVQGINNSILLNSSTAEKNPGQPRQEH